MSTVDSLFVPDLQPALKHPTIFKKFDSIKEGESFVIVNDHDPKPLYYQLLAERGDIFTWNYLEQGPEVWKVHIKKNDMAKADTVGQIAAKDIRKAEVFKKYGIDFCCGGKKSLQQACEEKGLDQDIVEAELESVKHTKTTATTENFDRWSPDFLADYIFNRHHLYYYDEAPVIGDLLVKVANHHGERFPELLKVYALYVSLVQELNTHFIKEEKVLFPFIKGLCGVKQTGNWKELEEQLSISEPIKMMEADHDAAGTILSELSEVTRNYSAPAEACNSFKFLYQKLQDLDEDLHQHIHLENNILFPKALALEKEIKK